MTDTVTRQPLNIKDHFILITATKSKGQNTIYAAECTFLPSNNGNNGAGSAPIVRNITVTFLGY